VRKAKRAWFGSAAEEYDDATDYLPRLQIAFRTFDGRTLIVTSEHDLTATEFNNLVTADTNWTDATTHFEFVEIEGADHTLSAMTDLTRFIRAVTDWL
jgi:hypothetical protein